MSFLMIESQLQKLHFSLQKLSLCTASSGQVFEELIKMIFELYLKRISLMLHSLNLNVVDALYNNLKHKTSFFVKQKLKILIINIILNNN